jgi:hypothetical protein
MRFHTVAFMSTKFGIMIEELPGAALDTWRCAWSQVQANLFSNYFPYKKGTDIGITME